MIYLPIWIVLVYKLAMNGTFYGVQMAVVIFMTLYIEELAIVQSVSIVPRGSNQPSLQPTG